MNHSDSETGAWSASIMELVETMSHMSETEDEGGRFDLNLLWQVIRQNRERADTRQESSLSVDAWYMVIIQVSKIT